MRSIRLDLIAAFLCALLVTISLSVPVRAERQSAPFERACSSFSSGQEFVSKAVSFCLLHDQARRCERQAREYFEQCRFDGQYQRISERTHANLLMMVVLSKTSSATRED